MDAEHERDARPGTAGGWTGGNEAQDAEVRAQASRGAEPASLKCLVWELSVTKKTVQAETCIFNSRELIFGLVWQSKKYSLFF